MNSMNEEKLTLVYMPNHNCVPSREIEATVLRRTKTLVEVSYVHPYEPGVTATGTFNLTNGKRVRADLNTCREWLLKRSRSA